MIIKARQYLNKTGLMSLCYSFIYPYLTYCNHIWGATYKTRLKRLVTLQNKAIRILSHARNRTSSDPLYKKLNITKLENINTYQIGRFMFCVSIEKVPQWMETEENWTYYTLICASLATITSHNTYVIRISHDHSFPDLSGVMWISFHCTPVYKFKSFPNYSNCIAQWNLMILDYAVITPCIIASFIPVRPTRLESNIWL